MNNSHTILFVTYTVLFGVAGAGTSRAQHFDVLVQQVDGQLVTGSADFDTGQWTLGRRVFFREFLFDFTNDNPGFGARAAGSPSLPPGSQALPGDTDLQWDFLPMTIGDMTANLFYWDEADGDGVPGLTPDDVQFGELPGPNYGLSLFGRQNLKFTADGSDQLVPGGVIDRTASDGLIHRHRFFFLEDGDDDGVNEPADGIYLFSMQLRMTGLANSLPIFLVFGTPGSSVEALDDAAVPWVEQNMLGLPGDYNDDGMVDAADYTVWRDTFGKSVAVPGDGADGDLSGEVDTDDYHVWKTHFGTGTGITSGGTAAVPEPATALLAALALAFCASVAVGRRAVSRPRIPHQRAVALLSFVSYSAVSLLGHGLHLLTPHGAASHRVASRAEAAGSSCQCGHHAASFCAAPETQAEQAATGMRQSHLFPDYSDCPVCQFLAQMRGAEWSCTPTDGSLRPTSGVTTCSASVFCAREPFLHSARGPPLP